jgi:hypothetical protein
VALETDPIDLLLDDDNDLVITTDLQFSRGIPAVSQAGRIALQMFQEEWFLDLDVGIPYWAKILGQKPKTAITAARLAFQAALEDIDSVLGILQLDIEYLQETRDLEITWRVRCEFGDTDADTISISVGG